MEEESKTDYDLILNKIFGKMIEHEKSVPRRAGHFMKVSMFAKNIALSEGLDKHDVFLTAAAGLVHDIGIKEALKKYGSSVGKYQEELGPCEAEKILACAGVSEKDIERICFLVGHHHTYSQIDGIDYQILVEADFLVNVYEDKMSQDAVCTVYDKYIKTESGRKIFADLFLNDSWQSN